MSQPDPLNQPHIPDEVTLGELPPVLPRAGDQTPVVSSAPSGLPAPLATDQPSFVSGEPPTSLVMGAPITGGAPLPDDQVPPIPQPTSYQPPGQPPTYEPPPAQVGPGTPGPLYTGQMTSTLAIASLVLSILGFVFLPVLGSILGVIFGHMARNEIRTSAGRITGDPMAMAGLIIGYIGIGLLVIAMCSIVAIGLIFTFSRGMIH